MITQLRKKQYTCHNKEMTLHTRRARGYMKGIPVVSNQYWTGRLEAIVLIFLPIILFCSVQKEYLLFPYIQLPIILDEKKLFLTKKYNISQHNYHSLIIILLPSLVGLQMLLYPFSFRLILFCISLAKQIATS